MTVEIDITDGSATNPNRHKHIYERKEDGTERSLVVNSAHVSVEDAAEQLDIAPDKWTWVYTNALVLDGAAIPCSECGRQVWSTVKTANINRGEDAVRCGSCVRADEESDESDDE